ncbi:MAG: hypothetical protein QOF49_1892 [Chloroflexota bacterium]|nr:hypothetical protein [Chloroflexota bacterium]
MTARILLGVDGGNTKTVAVAAATDGTIVGTARVVRGSDIHAVSSEAAMAVFHEAADGALGGRAAGGGVVAAAFSLAGADWPEDVALLARHLGARWSAPIVVNDAIGALRGAIPAGPGVIVVCGTGTATGARGPDGRTWHSGFWQEVQGAHELGVRTLRAIYRAELGIDGPTALTERVLTETGEADVEALLHHATGRDVPRRRDPATLAWILLDAADEGDPTAVALVTDHGIGLGRTAVAAARRVGIDRDRPFGLALAGGVLRHRAAVLRDAIVDTVRAGAPGAFIVVPELEPVAGALLLAFDAAGLATGPDVRTRIAAGLVSAELFDTHPVRATMEAAVNGGAPGTVDDGR